MVFGGKINVCGVCDQELLGRAEVEAIVTGRENVYLAREHMQLQTYVSGSAFVYAQFNGQTGSRGETKNIVCGCTAVHAETPSLTMIRGEFRERVKALFGDELSVPLLFSIPPSMVAWENSGVVKARSSEEGLVLSSDGMALVEIVADMSRIGLFNGAAVKFGERDIMQGFTYLHMILPRYRSFVAMDYGSHATLEDLFAHVPLGWFDWVRMLSLQCVAGTRDGDVCIVQAAGVPLLGETARFMALGDRGRAARAVCAGSSVTRANTCIQFLPTEDIVPARRLSFGTFETSQVLLSEGQAFIPAGPVLLQGSNLAVTFEPGVQLRTRQGTVVSASGAAVTIFLNGTVELELRAADTHQWHVEGADGNGVTQMAYQVSVVCESYLQGTKLHSWYAKRFDVLSSSARFFTGRAEFLLLSCPKVSKTGAVELKLHGGKLEDGSGVGFQSLELVGVPLDSRLLLRQLDGVVLGGGTTPAGSVCVVVNDVVEYQESVALGLFMDAVITFRLECLPAVVSRKFHNKRFDFRVSAVLPMDYCVIDGGGPSASDGEFYDDTSTYLESKPMTVLYGQEFRHRQVVSIIQPQKCVLPWYPDAAGLSYVLIAKHGPTLAYHLGVSPTLREVLKVAAEHVDEAAVMRTGWVREESRWLLTTGGVYDMTWKDLTILTASWFSGYGVDSIFRTLLVRMFGLQELKLTLSFKDRCN